MTNLEIGALGTAAVWLGIVTLGLVLAIRQIALLTARVEHVGVGAVQSVPDDGPPLGTRISAAASDELPELAVGSVHLVLLSATCTPCRDMAEQLRGQQLKSDYRLIALIPGRESLADGLVSMLPQAFLPIRDPMASDIAQLLEIQRVPFAMTLRDGAVVAKAPILESANDLKRFLSVVDSGSTGQRFPIPVKEVIHVGS